MADAYPPDDRRSGRPDAPWWRICRGVGVASDPRSVVLAALGVLALRAGWSGLALAMGEAPWFKTALPMPGIGTPERLLQAVIAPAAGLIAPFVAMFRADVPAWSRIVAGLASLWALVVWGIIGQAIARVAVVRVATERRVGIVSALRFSLARLGTTVAAPVAPILVAILIGLAGACVGLLDRLPGSLGTSVATLLAIVPLVVGLLDAVILLGLALAWPLMVATVAAEGEDFFEAISRSYSYVNQRTAPYAAYLLLAAVVGAIGLAAVGLFVAVVLGLADWSVSLGAPSGVGFRFLDPASADRSGAPAVARFWTEAVATLAAGWTYSYLWTSASILYLVLRRDVDGADVHDIYEPGREADEGPSAKSAESYEAPATNAPSIMVATTGPSPPRMRSWGSSASRSGRATTARSARLPGARLPATSSIRRAQAPKRVAIVSRSGPLRDGSRAWRKRTSSSTPRLGDEASPSVPRQRITPRSSIAR